MATDKKIVNVWDPLVRFGHWTLALSFLIAYVTEDEWLTQHVWAGYVAGTVVLVRIFWGFIGSRYARFSNFVRSPAKSLSYLKNLAAGQPQHYIGHNPAGGAMVILLLFGVAATTLSGMKLYAVEENKGPFAMTLQQVPAMNVIANANAKDNDDEDEREEFEEHDSSTSIDKESEELWETLHEIFANFTLILVFFHIAGVVISSIVDKENLVKAMLTGKKEIDDSYQ